MLQVPLVRKAKRVATQLNCGATQFYCVATDAAVATWMPPLRHGCRRCDTDAAVPLDFGSWVHSVRR
jgi:hypothetical protein